MDSRFFIGLDLGQANEYTALAILERSRIRQTDPPSQRRPPYALKHLQRFQLGTSYPEIVQAVLDLFLRMPKLAGALLAVDQTGSGYAAIRLLDDGLRHKITCSVRWMILTMGHDVVVGENGVTYVPKKELIGVLQVLLQTRRLQIARTLADAHTLVEEMEKFKVKITLAQCETVDTWREGPHDDLVLATAIAAWCGEQALPPLVDPPPLTPRRIIT